MTEATPQQKSTLAQRLWNDQLSPSNLSGLQGNDQTLLLFEMYRLCVGATDEISNRRMRANFFFQGLNAAAFIGMASFFAYFSKQNAPGTALGVAFISLLGACVCQTWKSLLAHYREINKAKFEVIGELEQRLPAAPLVGAEGYLLYENGKSRRKSLSSIEALVPRAMQVFYIVAIIATAVWQKDRLENLVSQVVAWAA